MNFCYDDNHQINLVAGVKGGTPHANAAAYAMTISKTYVIAKHQRMTGLIKSCPDVLLAVYDSAEKKPSCHIRTSIEGEFNINLQSMDMFLSISDEILHIPIQQKLKLSRVVPSAVFVLLFRKLALRWVSIALFIYGVDCVIHL